MYSFKQPSADELDHTFLWRASRALPERGRIDIFNRSYQEGVLVLRVHAEILDRQQLRLAHLEASACGTRKFSPAELAEPAHWDDYMVALEDALSATSTRWAPWYVIPADHEHVDHPRRPAIQRPEATRRG